MIVIFKTAGKLFLQEKVDQELDLENFVPQNKFSVYMLLSLYLILQVLSVVIHVFFIPRLRQSDGITMIFFLDIPLIKLKSFL